MSLNRRPAATLPQIPRGVRVNYNRKISCQLDSWGFPPSSRHAYTDRCKTDGRRLPVTSRTEAWPALPLEAWQDTADTLDYPRLAQATAGVFEAVWQLTQ